MNTPSAPRTSLFTRSLTAFALFAFASFGSACDPNAFVWQVPGHSDGPSMQLTAPAQVVPCDPPVGSPMHAESK